MDLVVEDGSRVQVVYFLMSENNVKRQIQLPWVSFGSDAASMAPEGVFIKTSTHPRAYGNFARLLGKYVRDEQVIPLRDAIRKLSALPADTLRIQDRGRLLQGQFADIVVFDPTTIADRATYEVPHRFTPSACSTCGSTAFKCSRTANTPARRQGGSYEDLDGSFDRQHRRRLKVSNSECSNTPLPL